MTKAGDRIINSAKQALAFAEGKDEHGYTVRMPDVINPKRIREHLEVSQATFAEMFGCNNRTLQAWEQGKRTPDGAARTLLAVIAHEPEAVKRALSKMKQSEQESSTGDHPQQG